MAARNAETGDQQDLAAVLRQLRQASGLTGDRLAIRVGVSQSKISKIETGRIVPSLLDVERILAALEVPAGARSGIMALARAANVSFTAWRTVRQAGVAKRQAQLRRSRDFARERWPLRGSSGHRWRVILRCGDG